MSILGKLKMNIIRATLKPNLLAQFQMSEIKTAKFTADQVNDRLRLEAKGILKGHNIESNVYKPDLILSEKRDVVDLFLSEIKEQITFDEIHKAVLNFDFENGILETTIFYELSGKKLKEIIKTEF